MNFHICSYKRGEHDETQQKNGYIEMRPLFLGKPYFPNHEENRMTAEGDVATARTEFLQNRFSNLDFLLHSRYSWMNHYINMNDTVLEIGCGAGLSPLYLKKKPILTDAVKNEWVDKCIDATDMDIEDNTIDVLIASHTIHHLYSPYKFFMEGLRILRPGGFLLIQEINTSLSMRIILRLMRHEGWSYDVNVFDKNAIVNDGKDLWSANCAIPQLLFCNEKIFSDTFNTTQHKISIQQNDFCEFLLWVLSGGVIAKTKVPRISHAFMKYIDKVDKLLISLSPKIFALGRRVVIQKQKI